MKHYFLFIIIIFFSLLHARAQQDTIVVYDYTKVLLQVSEKSIKPQPDLEQSTHVGFFVTERNMDKLLVCNDNPFYLWSNGMMLFKSDHCQTVSFQDLFVNDADSTFISISSKDGFDNFRCEKVVFEPFQKIYDRAGIAKKNNGNIQFWILSSLAILLILAYAINGDVVSFARSTGHLFSLRKKALDQSSFMNPENLLLILLSSVLLAFIMVTPDIKTAETLYPRFFYSLILGLASIFSKKILTLFFEFLCGLQTRKVDHTVEFTKFLLVLQLPLFTFLIVNYMFDFSIYNQAPDLNLYIYSLALFIFSIWITLKFITNYSNSKLILITYLCATEYLPAVIMVGWFFK